MARRNDIDWEAVERDYRAGIKTLRQIAGEHNISHVAVTKKAKAESWSRDLATKIKAKAEELVNKNLVNSEVTKERLVTEREIIDVNAQSVALIDLEHRTNVRQARGIVKSLLGELEFQVANKELYEKLGEILESGEDAPTDKLHEIYMKVISFSGRTDNAKKLADTLKTLVELERKIVKLDGQEKVNESIEEIISRINAVN